MTSKDANHASGLMVSPWICSVQRFSLLMVRLAVGTGKRYIYIQIHLERIQRAATRWVKGLRGLTYEERLQALKLQPLGKRRLKNDLVLTHKILYNHIDLDATQLFKFSRRPGLRKIIYKTASSSRENTQKMKQFCVQGCK